MSLESLVGQQMSSALAGSSSCSCQVYPLPLVRALMGASILDSYWPKRHACWLWTFTHS
jgi:hypothetical protein